MALQIRLFSVIVGLAIFFGIFALVRKKKLTEEFSWLWMLTGAAIAALSILPDTVLVISRVFGIASMQSALFFFSLVFLMFLNLFLSMKISTVMNQVRTMAQNIALLNHSLKNAKEVNKIDG